jgi:hypothetical protein
MTSPEDPKSVRPFQLDFSNDFDVDLRPRYGPAPEPLPVEPAESSGPKAESAPGPAEPPPVLIQMPPPFHPSELPAPPAVVEVESLPTVAASKRTSSTSPKNG